jgi:CheY-like chemotaxis protein
LARTIGPTIRISKALADDLWPALADPSQIEIALLNLTINARDAMPVGGSLLLETANLAAGHPRLPPGLDGDFVMLAVSDDGMGMTADVKAKAFEPFFTTKEIGKGTGLGLSMVYGVAKQSGGAATLDSEPGKGTTVAMFLPRAAAIEERLTHAVDTPSSTGERASGHVLVADDDRDVRDLTVTALSEIGLVTSEAESGAAALDMLDRVAAIDLLVVDYAMPGLNGVDVVLRARRRRPDLPVILITGYAEAGFAQELPQDVQLLRKPFRVADLIARVSGALRAAARSNIVPLRTPKG